MERGQAVPLDVEELALVGYLRAEPGRPDLASRLCAVVQAQGKPVPLELEELTLKAYLKNDPGRLDLAVRLCAVLQAQRKPVPSELEELALNAFLKDDPGRLDLADRLCAVLQAQGKSIPPELERLTLVGHLKADSGRVDLAVRLADLVRGQGQTLDSVAELDRWCLTTDPHTRSLEPFVFMHIPKTAGSIIRLIVLSLFDRSRVFPGWNYPEFDTKDGEFIERIDPDRHGVFVGHMEWDAISCIEVATQSTPTVFTVLRDPVDHYRSQLSFIDELGRQGNTSTVMNGKEFDFVEFWNDETRAQFGTLLLEAQVASLLARGHPLFQVMEHPTRFKVLVRADDKQLASARAMLFTRLEGIHVAIFDDLRRSLDLLCRRLALPYQDIPGLRLNRSFADHSQVLSADQLAQVEARRSLCFELDRKARDQFGTQYREHLDNISDIPIALNDGYRQALLEKLTPHWCVHLDAGNAWPGYGWGFREENEHGQTWRRLGPENRSTIIARLRGGCDYVVGLKVQSCEDPAILDKVRASANGAALAPEARAFIDGHFVLNWLMPSALFERTDGAVDVVFELADAGAGRPDFSVAGISIYPVKLASAA